MRADPNVVTGFNVELTQATPQAQGKNEPGWALPLLRTTTRCVHSDRTAWYDVASVQRRNHHRKSFHRAP
jgi:hypothetical protein